MSPSVSSFWSEVFGSPSHCMLNQTNSKQTSAFVITDSQYQFLPYTRFLKKMKNKFMSLSLLQVAFRTCEGKRPMLSKDTPSWVETLITSCWTDDQFRRPMFCNIRQQIDSMIVNNQATLPSKGPLAANGGNSEASPNALYVSPSRFT